VSSFGAPQVKYLSLLVCLLYFIVAHVNWKYECVLPSMVEGLANLL
jgi:hypothetical protein